MVGLLLDFGFAWSYFQEVASQKFAHGHALMPGFRETVVMALWFKRSPEVSTPTFGLVNSQLQSLTERFLGSSRVKAAAFIPPQTTGPWVPVLGFLGVKKKVSQHSIPPAACRVIRIPNSAEFWLLSSRCTLDGTGSSWFCFSNLF